jgi:1-acyl-sn-glycerol-3-phosphate acyltransferase
MAGLVLRRSCLEAPLIQRYFTEPYQFIPPYRGARWCWLARHLIPGHLRKSMGVTHWRFEGLEHLSQSVRDGAGILLTPNHSRWPDPVVMGVLGITIKQYFYYVVSYHLFKMSRLRGWVMNRVGGYSILREGADRESIRTSVRILAEAERPIVLFPEGTWFRQNDRLGPLQEGVALIARQAAKQTTRPVSVHPVGIKYWFLDDPCPALRLRLAGLETHLGWRSQEETDLIPRVEKLGNALLSVKEIEHFGQAQSGTLDERIRGLVESHVAGQEKFYLGKILDGPALERIRRLRQRLVRSLAEAPAETAEHVRVRQSLDVLLFCENLNAHSMQYLRERPSRERLVETVQRIEETVSDEVETAVGRMGAAVVVGPALDVRAFSGDELMSQIASRIQRLLDHLLAQGPPQEWNCPPPLENRC